MDRSARLGGYVAAVLLLCLLASPAAAGSDYSDKNFSVRLPPAFVRFTEVSAMGGETVANRFSSAINPAALDWVKIPNKYGVVVAPYYSGIFFTSGVKLNVTGQSITYDLGKWGTIQPTLAQIHSNTDKDLMGMEFDYDVNTAQVQWGKRVGDWAMGANFNFNTAAVTRSTDTLRMADSNAENYRFRFGGLWEPVKKWLVGSIFEFGWSPFRSQSIDPMSLFLPPPRYVKWNDTQYQYIFRPGISYEYAELSHVFLDYQWGLYENSRYELIDNRFSTGVEHRLLEWLLVRPTISFDVRGNVGGGIGASFLLSRHCSFDVGYQYNMLPEIQPEFGRAHTVQATFAVRF